MRYSIVLIAILTVACGRQFKPEGYRLLSPNKTNITFNNEIVETDSLNPLEHFYIYNGAGVGIGDINNDGLPDIFFAGNLVSCRLYLNQGNMQFTDITEQAGVDTKVWCTGVSMVDLNTDGLLDIYVSVADKEYSDKGRNLLFINQGNNEFVEQAAAYGLDDPGYSTQAVFFDYDGDEDLDAYLLTNGIENKNHNDLRPRKLKGEGITTDRLYRNNGDLTFTNVSEAAGITAEGYGLGVGIMDVNNDGWPDIYCANDFITNDLLWINHGDGTFTDSLSAYFSQVSHNGMGMDIADFNNDGLTDLVEMDMLPETNKHHKTMTPAMNYNSQLLRYRFGYSPQFVRNALQLQRKGVGFSEIGRLAGIHKTDWSWAPLFLDMDNDGWKDLFVSNGYGRDITDLDYIVYSTGGNNPFGTPEARKRKSYESMKKLPSIKIPNYFFRNTGDLIFSNMSLEWGLNSPGLSNGAAYADLDLDGDLDLVTNNINETASVYENLYTAGGSNHHYLRVKLEGSTLNPLGIGTKLFVYCQGKFQYFEHYLVRGYVSSVEPIFHVGLGGAAQADSLVVVWPNGKKQRLEYVTANQTITVKYENATGDSRQTVLTAPPLLTDQTQGVQPIRHRENSLIDFENQPLLLKMLSREGPALAVGDVNGDHREDLVVGSSFKDTTFVWLQTESGKLIKGGSLAGSSKHEDQGLLLFDFDGDGDLDLYASSGGNQFPRNYREEFYQDRLYINDGSGQFVLLEAALPQVTANSSTVNGCDFDRDGDIDLFVGARVLTQSYPQADRSFLLENDRGKFTDITPKDLSKVGMVTAALWSDFDDDGWTDLVVTGEWMPVSFFKNDHGILKNVTQETKIGHLTGFWNSISAADFDRDGDIDYVVGNHGKNNELTASRDAPLRIVAKDFDQNGSIDPVIGYYVQGEQYPLPSRDALIAQMNFTRKRFPRYHDYAIAKFEDLFTENELSGALQMEVTTLETSYIENLGGGKFQMKPLPLEAQTAPVYGINTEDINGDGFADILLTGNRRDSELLSGFLDGSIGHLLLGDGLGNFTGLSHTESGFVTPGDTRGIVKLLTHDTTLYLVACNDADIKAFGKPIHQEIADINAQDAYAIITHNNGSVSKLEFYYGSGYLGQSSRTFFIPNSAQSIEIFDSKGVGRKLNVNPESL